MRIECDFCQGNSCIEDEYGEWKLEAVKIEPLPPIVLSGDPGIVPYQAEAPYWVLFMKYLDEDFTAGEKASFPINFCPVCGRDLRPPKKPLTPDEWIRKHRELRKKPGYEEQRAEQLEAAKRRDTLFAELDQMDITHNPDGSVEVPFTPKEKNNA